MYHRQYHQPSSPSPSGKDRYRFTPGAVPKKSPSGAHTLGSCSPSHRICKASCRIASRSAGGEGKSIFTRIPVMAAGPPFKFTIADVLPSGTFTDLLNVGFAAVADSQ